MKQQTLNSSILLATIASAVFSLGSCTISQKLFIAEDLSA